MSDAKQSIPKFGSFRPKAKQPSETTSEAQKERKHQAALKDSHAPRGKEDKDDHHQHRRRRSRSKDNSSQPIEVQPPLPTEESTVDIFFIDKRGDEKNLVYGSIHRYNIPAFHRAGAGNVLGTPSNFKIDRNFGDDKGIVLFDWRDSSSSRREKYAFSKIARERPRLLRVRHEATLEDVEDFGSDFMLLDGGRGNKRKRSSGGDDSDSEHDETHYRSIHGKRKVGDHPEDNALRYATDSDSEQENGDAVMSNSSTRLMNVELSRAVEQSPNDIDAWIALIEIQNKLLRGDDDRHRTTNAELRSTADIKIHMYEKALSKARSLYDRERLLQGLMSEGAKIWESKVQSERWEQISKDNIDSLTLWKSYVNFRQTSFPTFHYEDIRDIFISRIKLLLKSVLVVGSEIEALYRQLIYVILRATVFIRESGFSELSVAIWQGLLEINFCGPQEFPTNPQVPSLGDFWESEVARIGEDEALGWRSYLGSQDTVDPPSVITDPTENDLVDVKLFKSWSDAERLRNKISHLPARTMDEVVEDDPYRVILFSDIEDFLITIPPGSDAIRKLLLDAFLVFCRLQPMSQFIQEPDFKLRSDPFTENELLECDPVFIKDKYSPTKSGEEALDEYSVLNTGPSNYVSSSDSMFSSKLWFRSMPRWRDQYTENNEPISYKQVRSTLRQLVEFSFREDLAEYYLAFEWANEPDTIKKTSKRLLKQHPTSLRLYNAYAMIESARGNKEVADGVFSAALNMSGSISTERKQESVLLWKSWIWACLEDSSAHIALAYFISMPDGVPLNSATPSPSALLKTKQHLFLNRDYLLSSGDIFNASIYAELLALLDYITANSSNETQSSSQGDITSALKSYTRFSKGIIERKLSHSIPHALLLQSAARLLYHHARVGPFRPALLRQHLTEFLDVFPGNTIFLALYTWNESRLRIDNRVRNILLSTILTPENDTLTSRLFAIHYEMKHGTIHAVRSAFENALSSPICKSSAGLWRFYILYCLDTIPFQAQAKDTWHRALRACPWAKELYILGFEKMSNMISVPELKSTWRIMGEKELRVHVDLEDKFEDMEELEDSINRPKLTFR